MSKYLKQGFIRKLEWKYGRGEISYSKMIDLIEQECIKNIIEELTFDQKNASKVNFWHKLESIKNNDCKNVQK